MAEVNGSMTGIFELPALVEWGTPSAAEEELPQKKKRLSILGSTGSIGCSTLSLVRDYPTLFEVVALTARSNLKLLVEQVREFKPKFVVVASEGGDLSELHQAVDAVRATLFVGAHWLTAEEILKADIDLVVAGIVGSAGVASVEQALRFGTTVALANKEAVVAAHSLLLEAQRLGASKLIPLDSEHSALWQLLLGVNKEEVAKLVITASGGPFLRSQPQQLAAVTPEQAVKHPRWQMGVKISIDSATLVNKGLELIESCYLFGVAEEAVEVVVHPQSIVHGLLRLNCGGVLAHLSSTDMRHPIAFGLAYPQKRLSSVAKPVNLLEIGQLTFEGLDAARFPAVELARQCVRSGGNFPALYTICNELAVNRFVAKGLSFTEIVPSIERGLQFWGSSQEFSSLAELAELERQVTVESERVFKSNL